MKRLLLIFLLIFQIAPLWAIDLLDLRVFPIFTSSSIAFNGTIVSNRYKVDGTGLRARFSGLRSKWLSSGTVTLEFDNQQIAVDIKDGEFSGIVKVASLASFTLRVYHAQRELYKENFSFPDHVDFLVVSDIDDTILVTEVNNRLKMAYNSMLKSSDKRKTFAGVPDLYRDIAADATNLGKPHFIYLSSSPAFLSRSLKKFLVQNNFPPGTLLLKKSLTSGDHTDHKTSWLNKISTTYDKMPMLLLGDSGEKDPGIYRSFAENKAHTPLVKGIIIHEVTGNRKKIALLQKYREFLNNTFHIPFIYWREVDDLKQQMRDDGLLK